MNFFLYLLWLRRYERKSVEVGVLRKGHFRRIFDRERDIAYQPLLASENYTVSQKNCAKLFLPELRQISTNFDNFWQKDGKDAIIMRNALEHCRLAVRFSFYIFYVCFYPPTCTQLRSVQLKNKVLID